MTGILLYYSYTKRKEVIDMTLEMLCEAVSKIRNGACVRIGYTSQVPVKAKYRNRVHIKKWVTTTGRLGVKYSNIKRVSDRLAAQQNKPYKPTNFTWVIPNKIKYHPERIHTILILAPFQRVATQRFSTM